MKKIIIMFAAVLAIASLSEAKEVAKPMEAKTNRAVASKVEATEKMEKKVSPRALTRQEIRNMPILERPNRPGHFYGNTVRRLHNLTH